MTKPFHGTSVSLSTGGDKTFVQNVPLIHFLHMQGHLIEYKMARFEVLDIDSSSPRQNGHHFADGILKLVFLNEDYCTLIKISPRSVPEGQVITDSTLAQLLFRHWTGHKSRYPNEIWSIPLSLYGITMPKGFGIRIPCLQNILITSLQTGKVLQYVLIYESK